MKPQRRYVDSGYRGHGEVDTAVFISGQRRRLPRTLKRELKRRSAIEPEIGHMKNDGRLGRCYLKGREGDAINVLLVARGHNLRTILAWLRSFLAWIPSWVRATQTVPALPLPCTQCAAVGFLEGKSAIRINREYVGRRRQFTGYRFGARGFCASKVGTDEQMIREYIRHREAEEKRQESLGMEGL